MPQLNTVKLLINFADQLVQRIFISQFDMISVLTTLIEQHESVVLKIHFIILIHASPTPQKLVMIIQTAIVQLQEMILQPFIDTDILLTYAFYVIKDVFSALVHSIQTVLNALMVISNTSTLTHVHKIVLLVNMRIISMLSTICMTLNVNTVMFIVFNVTKNLQTVRNAKEYNLIIPIHQKLTLHFCLFITTRKAHVRIYALIKLIHHI